MPSHVEVVIPWRGGCPHRSAALDWVRARLEWPVRISAAEDGPWCKALAVMPAVEAAPDEAVVVVADADVWCDGLHEAVAAVAGGAPWAIPHHLVHRLDENGTAAVLAGADWRGRSLDQRPYHGVEGGGIIVARREVLRSVPLDPRFAGWGQEDESHAVALRTLVGPPWRGGADLVHLWHPPQPRASRTRGSAEGWALRRRYLRAQTSPVAMRSLVEEARSAFTSPLESAVHDRAPVTVG